MNIIQIFLQKEALLQKALQQEALRQQMAQVFFSKKFEYLSNISPEGGPSAGSPSAANGTGFLFKKV